MKKLIVPNIEVEEQCAARLEEIFASLPTQNIDCCNWPKDFPYAPKASFKIFNDGGNLYIKFDVTENDIQALVGEDNGAVWTDPCVEFFVSPNGDAEYYNFECTCTGKLLLAHHPIDAPKVSASQEVIDTIKRSPSLGTETFALRSGEHSWSVIEIIPATALFASGVEKWSGNTMRANFYKCGDNLPTPHFLSWNAIEWKEPSFHRPEFFAEIVFE